MLTLKSISGNGTTPPMSGITLNLNLLAVGDKKVLTHHMIYLILIIILYITLRKTNSESTETFTRSVSPFSTKPIKVGGF